jgi:hypothetical protein
MKFWNLIYKFKFVRKHWDFANSLLEGAHERDSWPYLFLYRYDYILYDEISLVKGTLIGSPQRRRQNGPAQGDGAAHGDVEET